MEVSIHSSVPLDLHPEAVLAAHADALKVQNSPGEAAYHSTGEAFAAIYKWHAAVEDAEDAFRKVGLEDQRGVRQYVLFGQKRVFHGNEPEVYEAAQQGAVSALRTAEHKLNQIKQNQHSLELALDDITDHKPRKAPEGISLGSEIRRHLLGLKDTERVSFIQKAIRDGDKQLVAAALRAPAFLSGLKENEVKALQRIAEEAWAPQQYAQKQALDQIVPKLEAALSGVLMRQATLEKTLGAAKNTRQQANKALRTLRGERVAK